MSASLIEFSEPLGWSNLSLEVMRSLCRRTSRALGISGQHQISGPWIQGVSTTIHSARCWWRKGIMTRLSRFHPFLNDVHSFTVISQERSTVFVCLQPSLRLADSMASSDGRMLNSGYLGKDIRSDDWNDVHWRGLRKTACDGVLSRHSEFSGDSMMLHAKDP